MHDYTVQRIHDDRMRDLEREADRSAVAAIARQGRQRQGFRVGASRWLTALLAWPSGGGVAIPSRTASAAASARRLTPSLARIFETWWLAVLSVMKSRSAI